MSVQESIWSKTAKIPERKALPGDISVDVAVIGGGLSGILTAYQLRNTGLRTVVLEAERIGSGQTKNTTAKITSQHNLIYHRFIEQIGKEHAGLYAAANQRAIQEYRKIIETEHIDCDFEERPAYLYSTIEKEPLTQEYEAAKMLGIDAQYCEETELPFPVTAAVCFQKQAQFHPLKFLHAVADPLEVYEHTRVLNVEDDRIETTRGIVTAKHIVFCCHYPFLNVPGYYFMRMHQERSYVLALEHAATLHGMYLGIDENGLSFRSFENLTLLGGGGHRTGENSSGGQYEQLRKAAKSFWPDSQEVAAWSAQDCTTLDGIPYIGRFSSATPNWYVATGFHKWGMTSSMVSAMVIADLILRGESSVEPVFSPQRFRPSASAKSLFEETAQAAKGLTRRLFVPLQSDIDKLPNNHGGVVEYDGLKVGVYKNEDGEAFIVPIRCPHLGCQLEWNPDELSWDCPCHGSRFDYRGNLIDNPAQENLETL